MKKIFLTQEKVALVDDEDFVRLSKFKWCAYKGKNTYYATSGNAGGTNIKIDMHRLIMNAPKDKEVDHIDGNGLNNQRLNLRICTSGENKRNTGKHKNNKTGFKGVRLSKSGKRFHASIVLKGETFFLGSFASGEEAHAVYIEASKKYHGEFAHP